MTTRRKKGAEKKSKSAPASKNAATSPKSATVGDQVLVSDWKRGPPFAFEGDPYVPFSLNIPLSMRDSIVDLAKHMGTGPTTLASMLLMQKLRTLLKAGPAA